MRASFAVQAVSAKFVCRSQHTQPYTFKSWGTQSYEFAGAKRIFSRSQGSSHQFSHLHQCFAGKTMSYCCTSRSDSHSTR